MHDILVRIINNNKNLYLLVCCSRSIGRASKSKETVLTMNVPDEDLFVGGEFTNNTQGSEFDYPEFTDVTQDDGEPTLADNWDDLETPVEPTPPAAATSEHVIDALDVGAGVDGEQEPLKFEDVAVPRAATAADGDDERAHDDARHTADKQRRSSKTRTTDDDARNGATLKDVPLNDEGGRYDDDDDDDGDGGDARNASRSGELASLADAKLPDHACAYCVRNTIMFC
jgi:hypothetical protein